MVDIKIILGVIYHSQNSSVHLDKILMLAKNCVDYMDLPPNSTVDDVHGSVPDVSPNSTADVHGSVPDVSPNPAADVHDSADSQKVNYENHSPLMQSRGKENINVEANTSTFQYEKQISPQIRIDLSDMGGVAEDGVGVSVNEGEQQVNDTPKDGDAHQSHQDLNEHIMEKDVDNNVQHNIPHVLPDKITTDASESFTSTTILSSTQAAIEYN
ncbi:hypothetical protein EJD97_013682 [Solanum chilense]|uniref:Uncharacterized protein n=1 Tax=Solanum chilense TaxID=4083 RepID=A0A6N2BFT7_SOLCI|nr:hypothetical protein EJD97_013682 [Solanum chilense]